MLGERSDQRGLWEADRLYLDHVGKDTFYGLLASMRGHLFRDADFAGFYCADNGRDSVPPSLLATALLLQSHDKVSDAEAKARADFDLRWKVALGIEAEDRPFAKSTLQVFRAQLILHGKVREVFESSLRLARESGYLKGRGMRVALDTTNILGRGAVKDTCNLLADGTVKLLRALAAVEQAPVREWAQAREYERYLGSSVKGEAAIDWSDKRARTALLAKIVADADRLLELSRRAQGELPEDGEERQQIVAAAELLGQLLLQDVERTDDGVGLKDGVSRDRMMSVHDPEMRHGHKSSSRRFDGHKAAIVVDTGSQLITAVEVLPGNAPDNLGALELVEASEANTGVPVEEAMGDAAYGDGDTRQAFADAGRTLIARVPGRPNRTHFLKEDFHIDLEAGSCTCPAGNVTRRIRPLGTRTAATGRTHQLKAFQFDGAVCGVCPLRTQCVAAAPGTGWTVQLHPQEALLQQARALQQSEAFGEYRQRRVVVEHRLARLVQLGIRQSRYFGRAKTRFQLYLGSHRGQPDPGGRQSRVDGRNRLRSQRRQRPGRWNGQLRHRMARANLDPLPARISLTDQIPLPNKGFPSGFIGFAIPRGQRRMFLFHEGLERLTPGGAVHPQSSYVQAPTPGRNPHGLQAGEVAALEEALPDVLHAPLHVSLVPGVTHPGRIGDEAAVLGIFQETPGQPGMQGICSRHRRGEIVDDQVPGDAVEELPGCFQTPDHLFQLLAEGWPHEAVPGVRPHHDGGPHVRRRPVSRSWMNPRRPKSSSATSPGMLPSIRTVRRLRPRQLRRTTNRCRDE